ncbi:MAG: hypothetical protein K0S25_646 [Bacillus sp. (in: firmicutes)]|nr:hypothetical protein [Bacillus sp. (in: firmicutes)]
MMLILCYILGLLSSFSGILFFSLKSLKVSYAGDLVSTIGNIIGGIIGGIVAYIVAAYQVQNTFYLEKNKSQAGNSAILRLIKNELSANKKIIESCKSDYLENSNRSFITYLSVDNWNDCKTMIGIETSEGTLEKIMASYRLIKLIADKGYTMNENKYLELIGVLDKSIKLINNDLMRKEL